MILYPTDTVWGIGCDATNDAAVEKIFALKKRADNKAMIVLVATKKELLQLVAGPDFRVFDYLENSPKPVTVIYDDAIGLARNLTGAGGSVGIRICKDDFCKHLIRRFRKPIVSTSANISGQPTPGIFAQISDEIRSGVDYIVKHRQEETTIQQPSSVIRWHRDGTMSVIRQ